MKFVGLNGGGQPDRAVARRFNSKPTRHVHGEQQFNFNPPAGDFVNVTIFFRLIAPENG
jgi:hypothetical protein